MPLRFSACAAAGALLLVGAGCSIPAQERYERRLEAAAGEEVHAVQSERLERVMRGLEELARERLPQALDVGALREARLREVGRVARGIAADAAGIPEAAGAVDPETRVELAMRAGDLQQRALALAAAAEAGDARAARETARALEDACAGCHERFRPEPSTP
jgi:hypothetical protein